MIVRLISLYIVVLYIYNTVRINVVYQPIVRKTTLTRTTPPQKPDLPQKPIVHIFNANNGVGLGQVVKSMVPVLYTLRNEDYTHFNIHECGLNPPWRNAVSCEIRPKYVALFNNFKRTRGRNDYTKLKDTNQMEYFDGQKNWYKFLTSPSKPNTKMILIENVHNRWRPHGFNDCDEIKYWFDEPVGHLLKLVQEPAQKIQTTITFHIRTFADERIGIAFNEDLTLNETLAKLERNYEKENEQRIQRVINMQTQFPNMIQKLVDIADFIYEKTGKITHVAADSEVVRKCLRKYPFIHIITPGVLDYNKHFKTEPNYSLSEISDWYLLSLGKKIAVFPSGSTFSGVAQCRGGGKTTYPHKTEDMDVIFDNIKRQFQKNIELHVLDKDADFGAGFYMEGAAKIYEIADAAGIPSTSLHSCGTRNKPWHVTAMRCPKNHWHYAKRIKEMFKTLGPYQEIDDSKDFVHIDGQKQDWVKALQDLNPAKPTKVFLTEPHNKFIAFRYHYENRNCKGKKKWFRESIFEFPANIQNKVSFHLRFLTHEDYGIQISKNLSIHKVHRSNTLYDSRMDNQEVNIPDVKQSVDIILQYADSMFKKTGKATFIATDSDNVRKYTRQYPYISIYNITHDNRDEHKIHFSKASMRDLYTLAQAKHIITFPFKSQFSATAACLGDGKQVVVHTLDKLKQELSKHMNELEKSAVKIEKKTRKDLKTRATDAEKKMVGNEKVVNDVLLNSLGGVGSSNFIKEIEKTTVKSNDHADNDGFKHRNSDYFLWTSDGIYGLNRQGVLTKFNKIIIIIGKPIHSILSAYRRFKYKHINKWRRNVHRRWFKQDLDISKIWNMTLAAQSDVLGIQEYLQSWLVKCKEYRSICQVVDTETLYNHADYYAKYAGVKNVARFKAMSYQPTSTRLTDENIPSGVLHIYKTLYATAYEDMQHHIRNISELNDKLNIPSPNIQKRPEDKLTTNAASFPNIVFIKSVKVGGSTFSGVLRRVAHRYHLSGVNNDAWITREPGIWANHGRIYEMTPKISELKKETILLAMVRNPTDQMFSAFYHFEVSRKHKSDSDENIISFAGTRRNVQTNYIGRQLNDYNLVVVTERFNECMVILKHMFNCSFADLLYVRSKNSRVLQYDDTGAAFTPRKRFDEMSDTVQEYIRTTWTVKNADDFALWNTANKQLDDHIQKYTDFRRDLQYFETHLEQATKKCAFDYTDCYWNDNGCSIKCLNQYAMQHMT